MRIIHGLKGKGGELIPKLYGNSIVMEGYFKSHVLGHFLPRISAKLKKNSLEITPLPGTTNISFGSRHFFETYALAQDQCANNAVNVILAVKVSDAVVKRNFDLSSLWGSTR